MEDLPNKPVFGNQTLSVSGNISVSGHTANFGQIGQYYTGLSPIQSPNPNNLSNAPARRVHEADTGSGATGSQDPVSSPIGQEILVSENEVNLQNMCRVAREIGKEWKMLARSLPGGHLTEPEIQCIEVDARESDLTETSYQMLLKWKQCAGSNATVGNLAKALLEIRRVDIARQLEP